MVNGTKCIGTQLDIENCNNLRNNLVNETTLVNSLVNKSHPSIIQPVGVEEEVD